MIFFEKSDVLEIHRLNIERFGGAHGLRDESAFESALMARRTDSITRGQMRLVVPPHMDFIYAKPMLSLMEISELRRLFANCF